MIKIALSQLLRNRFRRGVGGRFFGRFGRRGFNRRNGRFRGLHRGHRLLLGDDAHVIRLGIARVAVVQVLHQIPDLVVRARLLTADAHRSRIVDLFERASLGNCAVRRIAKQNRRRRIDGDAVGREGQRRFGLFGHNRLDDGLFRLLRHNRFNDGLLRRLRLAGVDFLNAAQRVGFGNLGQQIIAHVAAVAVAHNGHIIPDAVIRHAVNDDQLVVRIRLNDGRAAILRLAQIVRIAVPVICNGISRRRLDNGFFRLFRFHRLDDRFFCLFRLYRLDDRFFRLFRLYRLDDRLFRLFRLHRLDDRFFRLFRLYRLDDGFFRLFRLYRLDDGFFRLFRLSRLVRVDLVHQNLRGFLVHRRHLIRDDRVFVLRAVIRYEIPQQAIVVHRVVVDRHHIADIRVAHDVPRVRAAKPRRAVKRRNHIIRDDRRFRLNDRFFRLFRLHRLNDRLFRLLRFHRLDDGFFRLLRLHRLNDRFFRLFRFHRLNDRFFRLLRFHRLDDGLFRLLRLHRLNDGFFRLLRFHRLNDGFFRLFRLHRRGRFKAILRKYRVGLFAIHRRGRLGGQNGQTAAGNHIAHDIQPLINRARKADIRKRQLGIQLTRFARQLKLSGRQQGDFIVAEHAFVHPVNGVAHRARHGRNRQKTERAVRQRDGNLHRQQHAFRREQLLRAGQRHSRRQNGAERKGRQPADDFFHRVSSFYR